MWRGSQRRELRLYMTLFVPDACGPTVGLFDSGGIMVPSKIDYAEAVAYTAVRRRLQKVPRLNLMAGTHFARVSWILRGGERPPGSTELTRQLVIDAVNIGLERAYGNKDHSDIDPSIFTRRDSE